jgi:hypothetical protein
MVSISHRTKTVYKRNDWGMEYSTTVTIPGYEVSGGFFCTTTHKTLKSAEKEAAVRNSIIEKFPWKPPRSQREIDRAKRLGL